MLAKPDFISKKILFLYALDGDKISFRNDNILILDKEKNIKLQLNCYSIFILFIIGGVSLTSGIIEKAKRFGFSIILMTTSFRFYEAINAVMEGNTLLRMKQYNNGKEDIISRCIIKNKIENQRLALLKIRDRSDNLNAGIVLLEKYISDIDKCDCDLSIMMGIEGTASKVYFNRMFEGYGWYGRQPRIKRDEINLLMDIGYTVLFNFIEGLVNIYGFDVYKGCLHREFYKRKSLVCDLIEPFRPLVDYNIRKILALKQLKDYSFYYEGGVCRLNWKDSQKYVKAILEVINNHRVCVFLFVQQYYRWFMKGNGIEHFPFVRLVKNDID